MSFWSRKRKPDSAESLRPVLHCSFCNKSHLDVPKLISGPRVYICSECVEICSEILEKGLVTELRPQRGSQEGGAPAAQIWCSLCKTLVLLDLAVAVRDRGWVCQQCVAAVREAGLESPEGSGQ